MGNANGVEGGGGNAARERGRREDGSVVNRTDGFPEEIPPCTGPIAHSSSFDSFANSPPHSPTRSRAPVLFAPPEPVRPLIRPSELTVTPNDPWMSDVDVSMDVPSEPGIPILITWSLGGNEVSVEGSWDNWTSRKPLVKSGKDHVIVLVLPCGVYHYKFIVDDEQRHIPDLPCVSDEKGHVDNILDVQDYVPDYVDGVEEFEAPPSPDSSYNQPFPAVEDFAKEPPSVPPHVHFMILGMQDTPEAPLRPHHVVLNHLFIEESWGPQSLVAFGSSHRFQEKFVTVVLYKPLRR